MRILTGEVEAGRRVLVAPVDQVARALGVRDQEFRDRQLWPAACEMHARGVVRVAANPEIETLRKPLVSDNEIHDRQVSVVAGLGRRKNQKTGVRCSRRKTRSVKSAFRVRMAKATALPSVAQHLAKHLEDVGEKLIRSEKNEELCG